MKKRILSIALVLCMLLSLMPTVTFAQSEPSSTTTAKDITLGTAALSGYDSASKSYKYVYYGTYDNAPIKWRILSMNGNEGTYTDGNDNTVASENAMFLLSEYALKQMPYESAWNSDDGDGQTYPSDWRYSDAWNWCNDTTDSTSFISSSFTDSEKTYLLKTSKANSRGNIYTDELKGDTFFFLSTDEAETIYNESRDLVAKLSGNAAWWWLRSPDVGIDVYCVDGDGIISYSFVGITRPAARPAFNLNLSSVLFTSAAAGGKSSNAAAGGVTENSNFADITGNDGYKLTMLDSSRSSFTATLESVSGNTATVSYSGATTGTNEYISVIIKNGDTVKYYGRVAAATSANDEVDITLPEDFSTANGDVLCVFNEQYNGDYNTDYASELIDVLFDYTVNFNANGATGTMASQTMTYGATASLSANTFTKTGYTFNGWNTEADGSGTAYSDGQSVTNLVSDASVASITLYAQWKLNEYSISYTLNGGTATNPTTYTVESEDITLNNPAKSGYAFTGWSGTGLTGENNMTVTIPKGSTGNRNYTAHYSVKNGYTVSFDVNGGDALADKTGVKWTDKILDVVPTPTRTGYTFKGWKHNNTDITADTTYAELAESDTVTSITLTAKWEENSNYTVSFDTAGGTNVLAKTHVKWTNKVLDGITSPTRDGYEFTGWKCENAAVTADTTYADLAKSDTVMIVTLTAQWKDIEAPTGEIKIGTNSWKQFLNNITFGLFFKDTQEVEITATDNSDEDVTIEYLLSDKELTDTELSAATFTAYTGKFSVEPNNEYVIYAKLTDTTGNVIYINSNGIVLDNVAPVISGIENGKTYCAAQTVTVSDKYEVSVTVNGEPVTITDGTFTLSPAENEQKIVVTDKAGNQTEMTVTVNDGHTGGTADCKHKAKCEICGEEYGEVDVDNHTTLKHTEAKAATTETEGNSEYWHCEDCGKYFSDKDGKNEIKLADTVIAKLLKTDDDNKSPQTGDNSHMALWIALLFVSGGTLAGITVYSKKKKRFVK